MYKCTKSFVHEGEPFDAVRTYVADDHPILRTHTAYFTVDGRSPTVTPLRAIFRRARQLGDVQANPVAGVSVPAVNRRQTRFATAAQIEAMLAGLEHAKDRALWATDLYAGLQRGELMALHREDVDLTTGVIRVERGWDQCEGEVAPKSKHGRRKVPIPAALRDRLVEYLMGGAQTGRIFVGTRDAYDRGREAAEAAGVEAPTLHECRHGYASLMIAAGVNVKASPPSWATRRSGSRSTSTGTCCLEQRMRPRGSSMPSWPARLEVARGPITT
jgi:integrase